MASISPLLLTIYLGEQTMNVQNLISAFSQNTNEQAPNAASQSPNPLDAISSMIPAGLAGGAAAGGIMALFMGSKSTRKMTKKIVKYGGTAVVGGLAYKAYGNWQKNKALGQTQALTDDDIEHAKLAQPATVTNDHSQRSSLGMVLVNTMIAASKADGQIDAYEHKQLFETIEKLNFDAQDKAAVFDAMARDITVDEIAASVSLDEHKAEVYLSAYLAIEVDSQLERTFLNNLAIALDLPRGFPAYLEQQADQGIAS